MEKFAFYVQDCTEEELKEFLKEAKVVANIVHHKVTVHTDTEVCGGLYAFHAFLVQDILGNDAVFV